MFSIPIFARASIGLGLAASAACAAIHPQADDAAAPPSFYTVTGEIALARHQPRTAALQYAAAAAHETDVKLLERAAQVAAAALQPTLAEKVATRWSQVDPKSVEAQRAAARADLALYKIDQSANHYRNVLAGSPLGVDAEFRALETELGSNDNIFGSRQLADRLASAYPASPAALRVQGFTALRADDPAAAVRSFTAALALPVPDDQHSEPGQNSAPGQNSDARAKTACRALAANCCKPSPGRKSWRAMPKDHWRRRKRRWRARIRPRIGWTMRCC